MDVPARRQAPAGLLGMACLLLLVEVSLVRHADDFAANFAIEWRATGRAAQAKSRGCQVLCFGDSLAKCGLALPVFERITGLRSYNLAISAGQAPASYFTLRRALDAGATPSAVLVDFKWAPLMQDYTLDRYLLPELVGPRDCIDLAITARDPWLLGLLLTEDLLPSARLRNGIRTVALEALKGTPNGRPEIAGLYRRNWRMNRGALLVPTADFVPDVEPLDPVMAPADWSCHPVHETYMDRFMDLAASRGIRVYWMLMPISPALQALRASSGADNAYSNFARRVQARHPNLTILDGRHSAYGRELFVDRTHLNRRGAVAWTADVADRVKGDAEGVAVAGRWVDMARYREPGIHVPLEDVAESRLALVREAETRRR